MRKKLTLTLLCLLIAMMCSGCAFVTYVNNLLNSASANNQKQDIIDELKSTSMSKETAEAGKRAADAYADLESVEVADHFWEAIKPGVVLKSTYSRMEKKAAKASSEYASLYSTDDIITQERDRSRLEEEEESSKSLLERLFGTNTKKDSSKSSSKMTMIIIIIIVVLIVVAVLMFLNKRGRATPKRAVPKKIEQKPAAIESTEIKTVEVGADLKVNYDKLLDQACTKLGLDKEEMLKKYDGDVRKAYEATNLM